MSFYFTTPIYYVNAQPHLGHAYSTIVADVSTRFRRLAGEEGILQTGTDEHGDKVVEAAQAAGIGPREYADRISAEFRKTWPPLGVEPDNFIRTTDPDHIKTVQAILQKVHDRGDIYPGSYSGLYCRGCERFLTEKELVDGNCPDHQKPPALIEEENYFFRMSRYQDWLINHIKENEQFITPERYRNEVLSFLKEPLEDLCISRPTTRLTWGIPLPFDEKFVTYVWFDALINYLTGIGFPDGPDFQRYWAGAEHIIAKDILKPHAIYWPTMLKAIDLPPFKKLHVHGYWNVNETKMSKSIGNIVRPVDLVDSFGLDTVRYFLMREMSFGVDASFSTEGLVDRQNSDLANDLGNLFSRSLTMIKKFAHGRIPVPGEAQDADRELAAATLRMVEEYTGHMHGFAFSRALQAVWEVIGLANRYIVTNAPWELAKGPDTAERLATVLYSLAESLRLIALVLQPIMPGTSSKMAEALGLDTTFDLRTQARWGLLAAGTETDVGPALFPRLEKEGSKHKTQEKEKNTVRNKETRPDDDAGQIGFDDFKRLDLRVGEITAAEKIAKSDRLLKLTILAPEERTVVAGIAEYYTPEEVVGRQVIIVANLKPVKLMGVTSHGMVLAVRSKEANGEKLVLTAVAETVPPGSKVS